MQMSSSTIVATANHRLIWKNFKKRKKMEQMLITVVSEIVGTYDKLSASVGTRKQVQNTFKSPL